MGRLVQDKYTACKEECEARFYSQKSYTWIMEKEAWRLK